MPLSYDEPLFRPPSEADALIIQATLGCSHNRCRFCEMYPAKRFRARPIEEVFQDIRTAARLFPEPEKVFLADGDAMVLPARTLIEICRAVFVSFPSRPRISAYASPQNMNAKSPKDLKAIRGAGISLLYYGVESGSDTVLLRVRKGATASEIERGLVKMHEAEFSSSVTWIIGLGGRRFSDEHARATAALLTKCSPTFTSALTLMLPAGPGRLQRDFPEWEGLSALETLEELKVFVRSYDGAPTIFRSNHASNYLSLKATLPADRERLISAINRALDRPQEMLRPESFRAL